MSLRNTSNGTAQSLYEKSVRLLAEFSAIIVCFFATGPLYSITVGFIVSFTERQYGHGFVAVVQIFWFVVVGGTTYALARATVATLIMVGGTALLIRFF